jgi:aspartyl-tRNA(Asn)/glutamyl-tRNA(Gln) amidotransferase subunit A
VNGVEEIARRVRGKEISAREITTAFLARIEAKNRELGVYLVVDAKGAMSQAEAVDQAIARGEDPGPLAGVPIALKDLFVTRGLATTAASRILEGWIPPYDGTAVSRLRGAGAVCLGKLNMDEFAMGSSNEHSAYGPCRNPWDPTRVPGGSSGGSAAAVAAGMAAATLGTDTGGSIRQPASLCGVVGIKPTYGRVSRYGVVAFASSLDQVGPLAKSVEDAALVLGAIAGHDPLDATSIDAPVPDYAAASRQDVRGLRVGIPDEYFLPGMEPEVETAVRAAIDELGRQGAKVQRISLPHTKHAVACYYLVATAEASSNLARYDGVRFGHRAQAKSLAEMYMASRGEGFGAEVKRRILLGTYVLRSGYYDAYYRKAQQVRALVKRDFDDAFAEVDVIATPAAPTAAFRVGEKTNDPLAMYLADIFTISCNLAGLPGLVLPCGFTAAGLPIGLQLLGRPLDEATLFRAGGGYERATDWHTRRPS